MFHLEISGIDSNDEHFANKNDKLLTLSIFHLEISGIYFKFEHF